MKPIDIGPADLETVRRVLREHVPGLEVWAFGSRVSWTARETSDLDIALVTVEPLDVMRLAEIREAFTKSDLPFGVDIVDWASVSERFQKIIRREYTIVRTASKKQDGDLEDSISADRSWLYHTRFPDHWDRRSLYSLAQWVNGLAFRNIQFSSTGKPVIKIAEIKGGISGQTKFTHQTFDESVHIRFGDLLFSWSGQPETSINAFWWRGSEGWLNQHVFRVTPISGIDTKFFYYLLRYLKPNFVGIARNKQTTGLGHVTKRDLENIEAALPPLSEQRAVAHVLGMLDNKIELNQQMNRTLGDMALALFKSWFVNFEPVRAKMDGHWYPGKSLTGLPAYLYDLFPDRLVDSKLGKVPKGWKIGVLDDAIELLSGGTPRTSIAIYWGGDIPWYTAKDAPSPSDIFVLDTERTITQAGVTNSSTKILPIGTTVITARGTVGRLACLGAPMAMNQTCYGIRGIRGYSDFFTYWNVRMTVDQLQRRTHGTIFDTITRQTFKLVDTVLPPTALAEVFESMVSPMMERMLGNARECCALSAQRDALLPKLMSGELRIFQLVHGRNTTK